MNQPAFASRRDGGVRPAYPHLREAMLDVYSGGGGESTVGNGRKMVVDPWRVVIGPLSEVAMMDWQADGGKGFWAEKLRIAAAAAAAGMGGGQVGGVGQRGGRRGRGGRSGGFGARGGYGRGGLWEDASATGSYSGSEAGWDSQESGTSTAAARSGLVFCHLTRAEKQGDGDMGKWYIITAFETQAKASAALKFFEGGYPW